MFCGFEGKLGLFLSWGLCVLGDYLLFVGGFYSFQTTMKNYLPWAGGRGKKGQQNWAILYTQYQKQQKSSSIMGF